MGGHLYAVGAGVYFRVIPEQSTGYECLYDQGRSFGMEDRKKADLWDIRGARKQFKAE